MRIAQGILRLKLMARPKVPGGAVSAARLLTW